MDKQIADSLIELKLLVDNLIEGKNKTNGLFLIEHQILFVIKKNGKTRPKQIVDSLSIAKSNLAIIAKKMIKNGLIEKVKEPENRKEIFYQLLPQGDLVLNERLEKINSLEVQNLNIIEDAIKFLESIKK